MGTDDEDIGNIQLGDWQHHQGLHQGLQQVLHQDLQQGLQQDLQQGLHNIRPELKESLLKQGVRSLEEAGHLQQERKTKESKAVIEEQKVLAVKPRREIVFQPVPVVHYIPYWRHSASHHLSERHTHYFY